MGGKLLLLPGEVLRRCCVSWMITSQHNCDGDAMMNRKKSAEVIVVVYLTDYEGLNNNNLEKFGR